MSGKSTKASGKAGNKKSSQNVKNTQIVEKEQGATNTQSTNNAQNPKNTQAAKNTQRAKGAQGAAGKNAANKRLSKKVFWLTIALCVSAALNITLIIILVVGNKGKSDINTTNSSAANTGVMETDTFSYSEGLDENGFWKGTTALDNVELFDYRSLSIPRDVHEISDGDLQSEINNLTESYFDDTKHVMDRAVVDGDTVNIDYVGSVGGVEFSGGSTGGGGTDVTAGSPDYIDDFLTQIIGHMPGETIDVEVTFPDVYSNNPDLAGKDALFVTTINYIVEYDPEAGYDITDRFVEENLYADHGWRTVKEMENGVLEELQKAAINNYVREYMANEVTFISTPDFITTYQEQLIAYHENDMLNYYQDMADNYEMDINDVLQYFAGVSGTDELIAQNRYYLSGDIKRSLVVQAIAEDAGISVSDEDMWKYLPDYATYEDQYGMPWLRQYVLGLKVIDLIIENAVWS